MPDASQLDLGAPPGGSKGIPQWIMVVGAVAGIVGVVILLKGSGGGGGTTAAGTSINAALGSIQEENMNLLGTTQAGIMQTNQNMASGFSALQTNENTGFAGIGQGLTTGFLNTQNQIGGLGTTMNQNFTNTNGLIGAFEADITNQLTAFSSGTNQNFAQLSNLVASGQASQAEINASESSLLSSIQNDVQSGLVGQQQANNLLNQINGTTQLTQLGVSNVGSFLGWQFYQLPNRYATYLPGGSAGNESGIYTNYNVSGIKPTGG